MTTLEAVAVVFGIVSVWLSVREHVVSWPTAIVSVSLYFFVFKDARLYADMGLQVFYAAISAYGWYHWLYGGADRSQLKVSPTPRQVWLGLPIAWSIGTLALGTLLHRTTNAALPYVDSSLTVGSLLAQWMMTRKYVENWAIWVALDVAYVIVFLNRDLKLTAFLYVVYGILAWRGFVEWRRSLQ
ncbi:MAG TPA: nicotinamide riboside transporter PnuC, partial [Gemmatimonadales bacterium]|nr:nicotinamide riboside transporter PnuC [Gemmatimonadales bacterium]